VSPQAPLGCNYPTDSTLDENFHEEAEARLATEYFWFLSGDPHQYDRIEEVHTRVWRRRKWGPPDIDWRALPAERVRYYPNPMERLVRMHHTTGEMSTGLVFQSPFDRSDAAYRR
jgi:hypothetical protein